MVLPLQLLKEIGEQYIQREFHCIPERSQIKVYSEQDWKEFCRKNHFDGEGGAVYVPKIHTAYLHAGSPYFIPNFFHEYFGHGIFYEHSILGRELEAVLDSEKAYEYLHRIREKNSLGFAASNLDNFEGFALWLEAKLCREVQEERTWEQKHKGLMQKDRALFELFQEGEEILTRFGLIAQMGFPKYYSPQTLDGLLKRWYASDGEDIDLALLYGSQKPYSDIDLLIVSSRPSRNFFNGWLDIYQIEKSEFLDFVEKFDISITEALSTGTVIRGDEFCTLARKKLNTQKITKRAIRHNRRRKEELQAYRDAPLSEREEKVNLSYEISYQRTTELLAQGKRVLGRADLK